MPPFYFFVRCSDTSFCSANQAACLGGPGAASAMTQGITDVVEYMNRPSGFRQHIFPGVTVANMVGGCANARAQEGACSVHEAGQQSALALCEM